MNICEEDFIDTRNNHNPELDSNDSVNDIITHECLTIKSLYDILGCCLQKGYNPDMKILLSKENQVCNEAISIIHDPNDVLILSSISIENILSNMDHDTRELYQKNIKIL